MKYAKYLGTASVVLGAFAATVSAANATVVIGFDELQNFEPVSSYYNGGLGGSGTGPGPNDGIVFSDNALALNDRNLYFGSNVTQEPSYPNSMIFLSGTAATMNVTAGFDTGFSFYYSAPVYGGSITVYSGLNATGTILATLDLPLTPYAGDPACNGVPYCPFVKLGVAFDGTAMSVDFGGTENFIAFDNITLGSVTPGDPNGGAGVPEPLTLALFGSGLAGLGVARRLRRKG
jgi:hypothetical protein